MRREVGVDVRGDVGVRVARAEILEDELLDAGLC